MAYLLVWTIATTVVASASWLGIHTLLSPPPRDRSTSVVPGAVASGATQKAIREEHASPAAPGAPGPQWTSVPNGRGGTAYRRTVRTNGGEAVIWCEPGSARIISTAPKPGFSINIRRISDDQVEVSFGRDRQVSRVLVRWWDAPYAEITESIP